MNGSLNRPRKKNVRKVVPPSDSAFEDWKRIPYQETAPEPVATDDEKEFGAIVFSRPLVDAIYPETKPYDYERIEKITGFGAWLQYETLNFALYPLADLKNINVRAMDLRCGDNVIPADAIEVRVVTYRDICYPGYSTKGAWRRLPEYLQDATTSDAPKFEPQRFCLTIHTPQGTPGGMYTGNVLVSHDGFDKAIAVPVSFEVFPFELKQDPKKRYSAYYYFPRAPKNPDPKAKPDKDKDEAWVRDVVTREFRTMAKYGFDFCPTLMLGYEVVDGKGKLAIKNLDFILDQMKQNGMRGPILVIGGPFTWLCESKYKIKFGSHLDLDKLPPDEYFADMGKLIDDFKKEMVEKKYPDMIFGPLDELSTNPLTCEYGCRIYDLFRKAGLKTYTTMETANPGFKKIDPYIDIFCSQAFLPRYEEIVKGHKADYWCYPNHNSYERKDMVIMCKGGRMTYGFGLWRSGFNLLVPWIWRNNNPNHFFRERGSGGANIFHPETYDVIMTTYWENFREGLYDLKYLYTLEEAIVRRAESTDPAVMKTAKEARQLLQSIWDSIIVEEKYLNENLWPSDEFDGRRLQMAALIRELYKSPETNQNVAPSVIVDPRIVTRDADSLDELYRRELKAGNLVKYPLMRENGKNLGWDKAEQEATVSILDNVPGATQSKTVLLEIKVDIINDGTGNKSGKYPAGWPGMFFGSAKDMPPMSSFDFFYIRSKVESDRKTDGKPVETPIGYHFSMRPPAKGFGVVPRQLGVEGQWFEACHPISGKFYEGIDTSNAILSGLRCCISESNYENGTDLKFYFDEIAFVSLKKPVFRTIGVPAACRVAGGYVQFEVNMFGPLTAENKVQVSLVKRGGDTVAQAEVTQFNQKKGVGRIILPKDIAGGAYKVKFALLDASGAQIAQTSALVNIVAD